MRRDSVLFGLQLAFTASVCAFLIVPVLLSMLAGLTVNYLVGLESGLTLRWVIEVWNNYRDTLSSPSALPWHVSPSRCCSACRRPMCWPGRATALGGRSRNCW